ncbi:GPI-linked NAD(P)(+)--arginine ADP-ribosyltransferase 1 [Collichthys lucidus]|uniref:NAD(P)(+)--arginine ADP-ribosyltransferase n=1 Tax=Collichthys lucidus TaxID=240159 RepID=A0A4U5U2E0_COLLU|nr:GPI-linked NAD(P)(+)--arginine ADP-ribosyltransferase 1 [Collichthys lucidus]
MGLICGFTTRNFSFLKTYCACRRGEQPFKMWHTRKLLFVAIIFTALCDKVTAQLLDMGPNSGDFLYEACREEVLKKVIDSGLLRQELEQSQSFQKAWNTSGTCSELIPGGTKEHTTALLTYLKADEDFIKEFNQAMVTNGANESTYENDFHFKSLHFLIMDSLMLLKPNECKTVYLSVDGQKKLPLGSKKRLSGFTKAFLSYKDMMKHDDPYDRTLFNITSCFFATLGKNICAQEDVALLSQAEVFTVRTVNKIITDDDEYTVIALESAGERSTDICHIFSRSPADVSTQWLVLTLVALSLFVFNC